MSYFNTRYAALAQDAGLSAKNTGRDLAYYWPTEANGAAQHVTPLHIAFAAERPKDAITALQRASRQADVGQWTRTVVQEQAVFACLRQGKTVRQTAEHLGMTKSTVGRIVKRIPKDIWHSDDRATLAVDQEEAVQNSVFSAWGATKRLSVEDLTALTDQRDTVLSLWHLEAKQASEQGKAPESGWPYRLHVYKFVGNDTATRDSLAMALEQSAWMAASLERDGSKDTCTLWGLLEELRAATTIARYDQIISALRILADLDGCWIDFIEPSTEHAQPLERR